MSTISSEIQPLHSILYGLFLQVSQSEEKIWGGGGTGRPKATTWKEFGH